MVTLRPAAEAGAAAAWRGRFWRRWIAANAVAELLGLGGVAAAGAGVIVGLGEPHGMMAVAIGVLFVLLGGFEGLVVGIAQARVLRERLPGLAGWVRATVVGALAAWALGMLPSTLMALGDGGGGEPPAEISDALQVLLAAGLGLVAGPLLAFFQWRCLRRYVSARAGWWLPANAAAWALGMPVIFAGAGLGATVHDPLLVVGGVGAALLGAGAVVGAVHGAMLLWILQAGTTGRDA